MFGKKDTVGPARPGQEPPMREAAESVASRPMPRPEPLAPVARPPAAEAARRPVEASAPAVRKPEAKPVSEGESKRLIVGRGITLTGEIRTCDRLVVEGRVEATLNECRGIEISDSGSFKGSAQIEEADVSGHLEGDIVVRERLIVRSTGRIVGTIRYGELEVERGGIVSGTIEALSAKGGAAATAGGGDPLKSTSAAE